MAGKYDDHVRLVLAVLAFPPLQRGKIQRNDISYLRPFLSLTKKHTWQYLVRQESAQELRCLLDWCLLALIQITAKNQSNQNCIRIGEGNGVVGPQPLLDRNFKKNYILINRVIILLCYSLSFLTYWYNLVFGFWHLRNIKPSLGKYV